MSTMETTGPGRRGTSDPETRQLLQMLGHTTWVLVLLTVAFFAVPLRPDWGDEVDLGRLTGSVAALAVLATWLRRRAARSRRELDRRHLRIEWLLSALYVLVLTFALAYAALAAHGSGQFSGLENRVDALYFSVTIVSTVGFGDIHATGSAARLLVTVHMVFNLVYLGTALRLLTFPRTDHA